jgi:hypothetical protein
MKKLALALTVLAVVLFVVAPAGATQYQPGSSGLGSFMKSPVVYEFNFLFGMTGTWSFTIDDSLWPDPSDPQARFDYIWNTFFAGNYDGSTPGAEAWRGYFDGSTLPTVPTFEMDVSGTIPPNLVGTLGGNVTIVVQVRDFVADGVLSQAEKDNNHGFNATFQISPSLGTGDFVNMCGTGSMAASAITGGDEKRFNFVDPPADDALELIGIMDIEPCPSPTDDSSWSTIKALYR